MKKIKCSNCGKLVGKLMILSPSLDKKKRNMCTRCAGELIEENLDEYVDDVHFIATGRKRHFQPQILKHGKKK